MFNIHSIFFKINVAFALSMIIMVILYIFGYFFLSEELKRERTNRSLEFNRVFIHSPPNNHMRIKNSHLETEFVLLEASSMKQLMQQLHQIKPYHIYPRRVKNSNKRPPRNRKLRPIPNDGRPPPRKDDMQLYEYKGQFYLHTRKRRENQLYRDIKVDDKTNIKIFSIIFIVIMLFSGLLFILLKRNLAGLKLLDKAIVRYASGEIDTSLNNDKKDEISQISNTFYTMGTHLKQIEAGRTLFLRNMMHELKTPLTKSSLYAQLLEESDTKDKLLLSLSRQEQIINEMAQIESISSKQFSVNPKVYRLEDMIDEAIDLLQIEPDCIKRVSCEFSYSVDFKLFSIMIKNFIDNALKYATDGKITIKADFEGISFISIGEKLPFSLENYIEPFFKGEYNEVNSKGFGLGLYLISEIVKKHKAKLHYRYVDGYNIFRVEEECNKFCIN